MPLAESPQWCSAEFPTWLIVRLHRVRYWLSRTVTACRGGVATLAAAGGTSQATIATGCRQWGQAGVAARVPGPGVAAAAGAAAVVRGGTRVVATRLAGWQAGVAVAEGGDGLAAAGAPPAGLHGCCRTAAGGRRRSR